MSRGDGAADVVATCCKLEQSFGASHLGVKLETDVDEAAALETALAVAAALPLATKVTCLWLWGASEKVEAAADAVLSAAAATGGTSVSLGSILDSNDGDATGAAKLARRRATAADALVAGGADGSRASALRQAPLFSSLVAAARACRAEKCQGVLVRAAPSAPSPSAAYPKPFADATALVGAGVAWRADAGADSPSAGGGRSLSQAELEAVCAAHLWRLDPPRREAGVPNAADADVFPTQRRLSSAAAAVCCGRNERREPKTDGRGTSQGHTRVCFNGTSTLSSRLSQITKVSQERPIHSLRERP